MITKNTAKNNPKTTTKTTAKKSNALYNFFSIIGFIAVVGTLVTVASISANAKEGVYIKEPFSCDVALADLKELQRAVKETPKSDFKYKIFLEELEAVKNSLKKHSECSAKGGK